MNKPIITRAEAKAAGLKRYFNGKACKQGHVAENYIGGGCVVCRDIGRAAYDAANRERINSERKAKRAANPEKARAIVTKYRKANREITNASSAKWRERNADHERQYRIANRDNSNARSRGRRAQKRAAEGHHTKEDIQTIHTAQGGKCACCKTKVGKRYHVDHIQPLARGGSNWPSNLQILCPTCNISKGARDPVDFMQSRGMLL